ncbi:MAG: phytanoyl-CoA dioxygenase family protein [Cyanobacteria bacterium P01_C01_bin.118]
MKSQLSNHQHDTETLQDPVSELYQKTFGDLQHLDTEAFLESYHESMTKIPPLSSFPWHKILKLKGTMALFRLDKLWKRVQGKSAVTFVEYLKKLQTTVRPTKLTTYQEGQQTSLTDTEIEFFSSYGLLPAREINIVNNRQLGPMTETVNNFCLPLKGKSIPHLHFLDEKILDLIFDPNILDTVRGLLGDDLAVSNVTAFYKPPNTGVTTQWHSATPGAFAGKYRPQDRHHANQVTVWVALTDAKLDNGCMLMAPRSFIADVFEEFFVAMRMYNTDKTFFDIPADWMNGLLRCDLKYDVKNMIHLDPNIYFEDVQQVYSLGFSQQSSFFPDTVRANNLHSVALPAESGEFYVFTSKNTHCALPNISTRPRCAVSIRYLRTKNLVDVLKAHDAPHYPTLKDEPFGKIFKTLRLHERQRNALISVSGNIPEHLAEHFIDADTVRNAIRQTKG